MRSAEETAFIKAQIDALTTEYEANVTSVFHLSDLKRLIKLSPWIDIRETDDFKRKKTGGLKFYLRPKWRDIVIHCANMTLDEVEGILCRRIHSITGCRWEREIDKDSMTWKTNFRWPSEEEGRLISVSVVYWYDSLPEDCELVVDRVEDHSYQTVHYKLKCG